MSVCNFITMVMLQLAVQHDMIESILAKYKDNTTSVRWTSQYCAQQQQTNGQQIQPVWSSVLCTNGKINS